MKKHDFRSEKLSFFLIGGRGNQELMETKHEANNLHKMFHIMY